MYCGIKGVDMYINICSEYLFSAMWSGQFVHLTQSWNNHKGLDANVTTWMDLLEANGYHTKTMGKLDYISGGHSVR